MVFEKFCAKTVKKILIIIKVVNKENKLDFHLLLLYHTHVATECYRFVFSVCLKSENNI